MSPYLVPFTVRECYVLICQLYLWSAVKLTSRSTRDRTSTSLFLTEWSWRSDAGTTSKSDSMELSASGWSKAYTFHYSYTITLLSTHTAFKLLKSQNNIKILNISKHNSILFIGQYYILLYNHTVTQTVSTVREVYANIYFPFKRQLNCKCSSFHIGGN